MGPSAERNLHAWEIDGSRFGIFDLGAVALEAGYLIMNYGMPPSIGFRASLVRPGSKH